MLDVDLAGEQPNRVGDGLFMIPLGVKLDAHQVFSDQAVRRTIIATTATQGWGDTGGMYLSRGTMTLEARPIHFSGNFAASSLEIALTQGDVRPLSGTGDLVSPLPASQQPDQDNPLGGNVIVNPTPSPDPNATRMPGAPQVPPGKPGDGAGAGVPGMGFGVPVYQLFDRVSQKWIEFAAPEPNKSYRIADPERYVDSGGGVLFRFINRAEAGQFGEEQMYFQLLTRIEGSIE